MSKKRSTYILSTYTTDRSDGDLVPAVIISKANSRKALADAIMAEVSNDLACEQCITLEIDGEEVNIHPTRRKRKNGTYGPWKYDLKKVDFTKGDCFVVRKEAGFYNDAYENVYTVHVI